MNTSFYNGVIGIKTHQYGIDVIADNISNIESTAYKGVDPEFSTIFSTALNCGYSSAVYSEVGVGSRVEATATDMSQGSLIQSDGLFDMAIEGNGWFGVKQSGDDSPVYYTRDGNFTKDMEGYLVNADGYYLLGSVGNNLIQTSLSQDKITKFGYNLADNLNSYTIEDIDGIELNSTEQQSKINLPDIVYLPPKPTQNVQFKANLDPEVKTTTDPTTGEKIEIPNIEHFSAPIISPTGSQDTLDMTFTKRVPQQTSGTIWDAKVEIYQFYEMYDPKKTYDPSLYKINEEEKKVYSIIDSKTGVLQFNEYGALVSNTLSDLSNGGTPLHLDLGSLYNPSLSNSGYDGVVSIKGENFSHTVISDGYKEGYLKNYSINQNGEIIAEFDNGKSIPVAKIALYHFQNDQGLSRATGSLFQESANSGKAFFYQDENGKYKNYSKISSHTLEQSNVSLANALTELIVMQKAYDANAKSITTSDQMIQRAINMKT